MQIIRDNQEIIVKSGESLQFLVMPKGDVSTQITIQENAEAEVFTLMTENTNHKFTIDLIGKEAFVNLSGLYLANNEQEISTSVTVNHKAAHTTSSQVYKGIANDNAKTSFTGNIIIEKTGKFSNASQLNKNILLSKTAKMTSVPVLQIDNDDVKCSHGSTTGALDKDALFYLQSRGYSQDEAKVALINSFIDELISDYPEQKELVQSKLSQML